MARAGESSLLSSSWDVFLCHTGLNKDLVRDVRTRLCSTTSAKVFFDEHSIEYGDTLSDTIFQAIQGTKIAVIFCSEAFFEKKWPQAELAAFLKRKNNGADLTILSFLIDMDHDTLDKKEKQLTKFKYIPINTEEPSRVQSIVKVIKEKYTQLEKKKTELENAKLKEVLRPPNLEIPNRDFLEGTRQWAFDKFDDWIRQGKQRVFCFVADAGMGKTTFMVQLLKKRRELVAAYHFCQYEDSQMDNANAMLLSIVYQLAQKLPEYKAKVLEYIDSRGLDFAALTSDYNIHAIFAHLLQLPAKEIIPPAGKLVIVIDALDELMDSGKEQLVDCIQRHFNGLPSWLFVCLSTRPEKPTIQVPSKTSCVLGKLGKFKPFLVYPESTDNQSDLSKYIKSILATLPLESQSIMEQAHQIFLSKAEGLFVYASQTSVRLQARADEEARLLGLSDFEEMPSGMNDFYEEQMNRILRSSDMHLKDLLRKLLQFVIVAREPLDLGLLESLLQCSNQDLTNMLKSLSMFLPIRDRKVHAYHKTLVDWLTSDERRYNDYFLDALLCEDEMARKCLALLEDQKETMAVLPLLPPVATLPSDPKAGYLTMHTLHHVIASKSEDLYDKARRWALDIHLMCARVSIRNASGHCDDSTSLSQWKDDHLLNLLGRAIRLSLASIKGDIQLFPAQLIGRLLGVTQEKQRHCGSESELGKIIKTWKTVNYGYNWWCPLYPTWEQANDPCLVSLIGHSVGLTSVAWSPDGLCLATASDDHTARLWDAKTGDCKAVLQGHSRGLTSVAWSPDGLCLATASYDKTARLWDAKTGECRAVLQGHSDWLTSVAWSPDGLCLATASDDKTARLWDAKTGDCKAVLQGHSDVLTSVAWSPDGLCLATASDDKTARLWDAKTGECRAVLQGHPGELTSVAWSPDGLCLATASYDKTARLWDAKTGECRAVLQGHSSALTSVAWSPDGLCLATASHDHTARLWDAKTGDCKAVLQGHSGGLRSVAWSPDGLCLATASYDKTARLWDAKTGECRAVLQGHSDVLESVAWSPDGLCLATASHDHTARLWDAKTGDCKAVLQGHSGGLRSVAWSPDGLCLATVSWDKTARLWDAKTGECRAVLQGHSGQLTSVAWSPDGLCLATASHDHTARLWDAKTGDCRAVLQGHSDVLESVAWSPDGLCLATASYDKTARLWDAKTGECRAVLQGHYAELTSVAWSPDGLCLATASWDKTARLWDAKTGECRAVLQGHSRGLTSVAWSPDGLCLATASYDMTARLWDAKTGECRAVLQDHSNWLTSVAWSPDGLCLATASGDMTARLWDAKTGECAFVIKGWSCGLFNVVWAPENSEKLCILGKASKWPTVFELVTSESQS